MHGRFLQALAARAFHHRAVNSRKAKVSKAAWLLPILAGLLAPGPVPPPPMQLLASAGPAPLAYAEPPPLAAGLMVAMPDSRTSANGTCANARHPLRFQMITLDSDPYPPTWRNPAVCLAVYIPRQR